MAVINEHQHSCNNATKFSKLFEKFTPYLSPFTVEYSISLVAAMYNLWSKIGKCNEDNTCLAPVLHSSPTDNKTNHIVYSEYYSTTKGLFSGFIVLVGCFLSIILFFVSVAARSPYAITVNAVSECILLSVMSVSVILAFKQTTKLAHKERLILIDCVLLFIPLPALFIDATLSIYSLVASGLWQIATFASILKVGQVLLQTPFIIDGLQRCSNSEIQKHKKPGRELITLLIVCNVSQWILDVFEMKAEFSSQDLRSGYYGYVFWTILCQLSLPLVMFYRFHSSVCLVEIWKDAYE